MLFGRKPDAQNGRLEVKGVAAGGREYREVFDVDFDGEGNVAIAQLWGRAKIKDLANQTYRAETTSLVETITQTALAYRLLSQYTAFVAVSEDVRVDPDGNTRRVEVPVELPDGVSYEGLFGGGVPSEADSSILGAPRQSANTGASTRAPSGFNRPASAPPPAPAPLAGDRAKVRRDVESAEEIPAREPEVAPQQLPRLEIVRADGLDEEAIANLTQYLQNAAIAPDVEGEMVLELRFRNGRTDKVLLDDVKSTLTDVSVLNELKRLLLSWQPPADTGNSLRITVRIRKP